MTYFANASAGGEGIVSEPAPAVLRDKILSNLRPVKPLAGPRKRALVLLPLGAALVVLVPWNLGLRNDVHVLRAFYVWGLSLLQMSAGIALVAAAFREVIPGRQIPRTGLVLLFASGFVLVIGITYVTWYASGSVAPEHLRLPFWKFCFRRPIELSLPGTFLILVLAARGVIWRPALVGALAGLASGLMSDAGWRTFCEISDPSHVVSAHFAAILAATAIGSVAATVWASFSSAR